MVSVKFSSVIHLTVDNYYLRGFGLISILYRSGKSSHGERRSSINAYTPFRASWPIVSHSALCLHRGYVHGSIHLFVALPISMVQEGLRKRLILPGGQYPDHALHSFAGPAPPPAVSCDSCRTGDSFLQYPSGFLYGCRACSGLGYKE